MGRAPLIDVWRSKIDAATGPILERPLSVVFRVERHPIGDDVDQYPVVMFVTGDLSIAELATELSMIAKRLGG